MIPSHLVPDFDPAPHPSAVVLAPCLRITCLTPRLLRFEYSPQDIFEDRPSQVFWYRKLPPPKFTARIIPGCYQGAITQYLQVETNDLRLEVLIGTPPSPQTFSIELKQTGLVWRYLDDNPGNLKGTYRTLDNRDGLVPLERGILSRQGWSVVDDSASLVFNDWGWLQPRSNNEAALDLYFFGYGHDYQECIRDYRRLTGPVPILPRWALGNWWSRYWEYSQDQIIALIQEFQDHEVPLSVLILDMDWHITETGNESSGWTGYTWNQELFPDPVTLIRHIHERGLKTALNLHPADGVHPHEEQFQDFASRLGTDPDSCQPIPFDLANPEFALAYFELLHHPQEEIGVDFWWIDWQQGSLSSLPGLDPLFWLNHLHFLDLARPRTASAKGKVRRPFIFSRWPGLGGHRYPIGFSGDTIVSWASLAYQPFFTANASNVSYGWWSHDIGGHMSGIEEPELYLRWVQYGVLSPIFRLHSTKNPYHERRPWAYDAEISRLASHAMRLRHRLIPYLYTMAYHDHVDALSLIRPLYHLDPDSEPAYYAPEAYAFGTELIAAPHTTPLNAHTGLSRRLIWLPQGTWYNLFTGQKLSSGHHVLYGDLSDIPLFAKEGAIIPLAPGASWGGIDIPDHLQVNVFPGRENLYSHYDDDGESISYTTGAYALTQFSFKSTPDTLDFEISLVKGDLSQCLPHRTYEIKFWRIKRPETCLLKINSVSYPVTPEYDSQKQVLTVPIEIDIAPTDEVVVELRNMTGLFIRQEDEHTQTLNACIRLLNHFRLETITKDGIAQSLPDIIQDPTLLAGTRPRTTTDQLRALLETITQSGVHRFLESGDDHVILWNQNPLGDRFPVTYQLAVNQLFDGFYDQPYHYESGLLPKFRVFHPPTHFRQNPWELKIRYGDVLTLKLSAKAHS